MSMEFSKLNNLFNGKNQLYTIDEKSDQLFFHFFNTNNSLSQSDKPDLILEHDDGILGIEHFEFNASLVSKKGSKQRQTSNRRKKEFDKLVKKNTDGLITKDWGVNDENSIENYIKNFKVNFNKHYNKISTYKENIHSKYPNKKCEICFFIEDSTIFANYKKPNSDNILLFSPLEIRDIYNFLQQKKDVDYFLFSINSGEGKQKIDWIKNNFSKPPFNLIESDVDFFPMFRTYQECHFSIPL